ncbi:MAG TPA: hypothetical protein VHM67_09845 [Gemmatimonadaceae bacterium]|nr:hypothetical protein [Gemmatimonadaceae bacterium]
MYLVQILLPLYDNEGAAFPASHFRDVRDTLMARFGGMTAYTRAPAEGLWREEGEGTTRDDIVIYEVMTDALEDEWWRRWRAGLEARFSQDRIVIRAISSRLL